MKHSPITSADELVEFAIKSAQRIDLHVANDRISRSHSPAVEISMAEWQRFAIIHAPIAPHLAVSDRDLDAAAVRIAGKYGIRFAFDPKSC